ncbi:hypothetical protein [Spongiimicrobium sp. 3-5]|uniref:hypothetical protein n=1 Tax=Spongiimicrobium sp. 3-5 TaxID=3332596 RepID=UPI00397FC2DA
MGKKIKLIWDFRGPDSLKIAEHHEKHLKEYILMEGLDCNDTGFKSLSELHSIAFMTVDESYMISVRDALLPHRGEIAEE